MKQFMIVYLQFQVTSVLEAALLSTAALFSPSEKKNMIREHLLQVQWVQASNKVICKRT